MTIAIAVQMRIHCKSGLASGSFQDVT